MGSIRAFQMAAYKAINSTDVQSSGEKTVMHLNDSMGVSGHKWVCLGSRDSTFKTANREARRALMEGLSHEMSKIGYGKDVSSWPKSIRDALNLNDFIIKHGEITSCRPLTARRIVKIATAFNTLSAQVSQMKTDACRIANGIDAKAMIATCQSDNTIFDKANALNGALKSAAAELANLLRKAPTAEKNAVLDAALRHLFSNNPPLLKDVADITVDQLKHALDIEINGGKPTAEQQALKELLSVAAKTVPNMRTTLEKQVAELGKLLNGFMSNDCDKALEDARAKRPDMSIGADDEQAVRNMPTRIANKWFESHPDDYKKLLSPMSSAQMKHFANNVHKATAETVKMRFVLELHELAVQHDAKTALLEHVKAYCDATAEDVDIKRLADKLTFARREDDGLDAACENASEVGAKYVEKAKVDLDIIINTKMSKNTKSYLLKAHLKSQQLNNAALKAVVNDAPKVATGNLQKALADHTANRTRNICNALAGYANAFGKFFRDAMQGKSYGEDDQLIFFDFASQAVLDKNAKLKTAIAALGAEERKTLLDALHSAHNNAVKGQTNAEEKKRTEAAEKFKENMLALAAARDLLTALVMHVPPAA